MKKHTYIAVVMSCSTLMALSCLDGPKERTVPLGGAAVLESLHQNVSTAVRTVTVEQVRPGGKYLFLHVREGNRTYWIAASQQDVVAGKRYQYNEALLRTDFESDAFEKTLDTLYLVTRLVPAEEAGEMQPAPLAKPRRLEEGTDLGENTETPKVISLARLFSEPEAFANQWVVLEGRCEKVNEGIMERNWLHLSDSHNPGMELVAVTTDLAETDTWVRIKGLVRLNRDIGAGYRYDILLEEAQIIPE